MHRLYTWISALKTALNQWFASTDWKDFFFNQQKLKVFHVALKLLHRPVLLYAPTPTSPPPPLPHPLFWTDFLGCVPSLPLPVPAPSLKFFFPEMNCPEHEDESILS